MTSSAQREIAGQVRDGWAADHAQVFLRGDGRARRRSRAGSCAAWRFGPGSVNSRHQSASSPLGALFPVWACFLRSGRAFCRHGGAFCGLGVLFAVMGELFAVWACFLSSRARFLRSGRAFCRRGGAFCGLGGFFAVWANFGFPRAGDWVGVSVYFRKSKQLPT